MTREAYALDLRQYATWCQQRHLRLFQARRADIECFARDIEARGWARTTIIRRLCTIAGFCRYADLRIMPTSARIGWSVVVSGRELSA